MDKMGTRNFYGNRDRIVLHSHYPNFTYDRQS